MTIELERLPPHDVEAEEAVLGSLLIDGEAVFKVATFLKPEDFFREKNRWAYEACLALHERNEPLNQITVAHELAQRERLEELGGASYLSEIISMVPTSLHVEHYAQIVRRTSLLRRLIRAGGQIAALGYQGGDAEEALARAEELLYSLRHGETLRDFTHIREVLDTYLEESGLAGEAEVKRLARMPTGFVDLDQIVGGLQRSDLIVLAARPSLGKTSLALNIAQSAAVRQGAKVGIFSLEMAKEQLVQRLLASQARVDSQRLRMDQTSEAEDRRIMEAIGVLSEAPIYVDDSPVLGVMEMRSKARRLHNEVEIDLLIVDYLQLIQGNGPSQNRVQEMSEISRSLKGLARELDVPLLAISQLSRAVESRTPHIPLLSDLRESGSIEQDADVVLFIYRDDVYYTEQGWEREHPGEAYPRGIADIIVAKHRNGPTGQLKLFFHEKTARFENLERRRQGE